LLNPFTVDSEAYNGYTATKSSTGTRIAADIKDIPFSVDVVPLEIWNDFAVLSFNSRRPWHRSPRHRDRKQWHV